MSFLILKFDLPLQTHKVQVWKRVRIPEVRSERGWGGGRGGTRIGSGSIGEPCGPPPHPSPNSWIILFFPRLTFMSTYFVFTVHVCTFCGFLRSTILCKLPLSHFVHRLTNVILERHRRKSSSESCDP